MPHLHDHHDRHHEDGHDHDHGHGWWDRVRHVLTPHSHDAADSLDTALESSARGIRAVKLSLVGLGSTALLQLVVVAVSGSVALLADTIHNFSDALTALPLWIAFLLGRRAATRRYTYGYGRAEDLAGLFVIAMIALSAVLAGWEAVRRLLDPAPVQNLGWVAVAGFVGFLGNEAVAAYRIRVGRAIGSAALVADGHHARTDGLTSLAVLLGAGGVALGLPWADPAVGLVITIAILLVLRTAAREVFRRLMDGVEPELTASAQAAVTGTDGVRALRRLRLRWIGHEVHADVSVEVDPSLTLAQAHEVARAAEHRLAAAVPRLRDAVVATSPSGAPATP
ncbi:cation diffusion facilitator family transporter [Phycicoccus sp. 3266]|uniref:cation diffusion facilitator family transporter n=1 Tax=Phycicoccus sp. 3266 TaxID=2817751 RepID=UPI002857BD51|nr:cation diffusion facilitator family transporter [Phycicoccus sp. 3266]MDR6864686.1 cation diffusion facilitator family transporter [Phycicoccus sp. 3266]